MKTKLAFVGIVSALLVLVSCGGGGSQDPITIIPKAQAAVVCAPGLTVEHDQYVALLTMPCAMTSAPPSAAYGYGQMLEPDPTDEAVSITLTRSMELQAVRLWQGTFAGMTAELGIELTIDTPDGHHMNIIREFDKHTDTVGNFDDWRQLHLNLPAGTVVTLHRDSWSKLSCGPGCVTQEMAQLYGTF